jgi:hypothetical protein
LSHGSESTATLRVRSSRWLRGTTRPRPPQRPRRGPVWFWFWAVSPLGDKSIAALRDRDDRMRYVVVLPDRRGRQEQRGAQRPRQLGEVGVIRQDAPGRQEQRGARRPRPIILGIAGNQGIGGDKSSAALRGRDNRRSGMVHERPSTARSTHWATRAARRSETATADGLVRWRRARSGVGATRAARRSETATWCEPPRILSLTFMGDKSSAALRDHG